MINFALGGLQLLAYPVIFLFVSKMQLATSSLSTLARLPWGSKALSDSLHSQEITTSDPPMRLQLFEFGKLLPDNTVT
jgi:hypothetical protein